MLSATTYAESLARRIFHGAGALSLVPYRVDSTAHLPVLAHGINDQGQLVVACAAADAERMGDRVGETAVRVDGIRKSLEFDVDITVASLHALADLTWVAAEEAGLDVDPSPYLRFGVLKLDNVFIRGPQGTTRASFDELVGTTLDSRELDTRELDAREQVDRLPVWRQSQLIDDVLGGSLPGIILADRVQPLCSSHHFRLWVADVDPRGIVLLKATDERVTTVLVPFAERATTIEDLARAVDALAVPTSDRNASSRI
ncbi:hypothetical protein CATRI_00445 [Corynebacterium atrinae]|uniref:hypothetical protein n=1 Tax=Corynebacterium atrinae TaxID=1336740 RepID=UPI0025B3DC21|nr:hypothetical protein [Corynebacterium atrinae]WJY62211.1 hypothetical protein CATRI_00445 [Corynebacterium atrinae]